MEILVLAKQIPEISRIQFDPSTGRIIRENVPLQMNSFDRKAVDEAIKIRERIGGKVTVVSMGPPSAMEILNLSLKMGCDRAILITDRAFAGADTLVTSMVLAEVVKKLSPDLVLAGKYSLDGETSQVPPEVAHFAGYNFKSSISKIDFTPDQNSLVLEHENEYGIQVMEVPLKAVLSVSEKINRARPVKPGVPDMLAKVEKWSALDLGLTISGQNDSPTVVSGTRRIDSSRNVEMIIDLDEAVDRFVSMARDTGTEVAEEFSDIDQYSESRKSVLGVVLDDPAAALEIASKLYSLSAGRWNIELAGNLSPDSIRGAQCHVYRHFGCESTRCMAEDISKFIGETAPEFVVFPSTVKGREISSFVAARRKLGLTADCVDLVYENGSLVQMKPAFGGGIVASITSRTRPAMATVRPGIFRSVKSRKEFTTGTITCSSSHMEKILSTVPVPDNFKSLRDSRIVIGIGKGIGDRSNVEPVLALASGLDAALGATRPLVDSGYVPRQQQIGLTGFSISPSLYLALGISGNDNHVVGIRYAQKVFSVNSSPDAPIFRYSDFGYVGDCIEFVKRVSERIVKANQ